MSRANANMRDALGSVLPCSHELTVERATLSALATSP